MASSFDPSLRYCLEDRRSRRLARRLWSQQAVVMAELKPDENSWSSWLHIRCVEREHHDVRRAAVSFSRDTIRQVETFAKRIDSRSGDPNMDVISTQSVRVLTISTSKAQGVGSLVAWLLERSLVPWSTWRSHENQTVA
jgi:hypothetical protein